MLGGFLFRAILSLVPSPWPAASCAAQPLELRPPGFRELFVAAMACARQRRPGCALGSARLCCAGAAAPPLPAASPHTLRWRWLPAVAHSGVRRLCWRAQRRVPGAPAQRPPPSTERPPSPRALLPTR